MSHRPWLLGLPLAGLLAACTIGPNYERPVVPSAAAFPESAPSAGEISAEWWKGFAEPELDRLVALALVANTDLRIAVARVEEASAQLDDTAGAGLPSVDATAADSRYKVSDGAYVPVGGTAAGRNRRTLRGGLTTSFELDFWGSCAGPRKSPGPNCSPPTTPPSKSDSAWSLRSSGLTPPCGRRTCRSRRPRRCSPLVRANWR